MSTDANISEHDEGEQQIEPTPLPGFQLFIVYLIQFAEPITGLVIYPFVNQLVRDTGINKGDETKTGYYAGLIESTFFLAECLSVIQWGYLSDRFGRRPILLIGPLGLAISMFMFGLSSVFWRLAVFRCLQGAFNGNIGVSKSVIAEITDETNIGDAYAYIPIMWSTGVTIAPIIGGVLSMPAETWPNVFGRIALFTTHPYFLPCATAAFISLISFMIALFGLKESMPSLVAKERGKENQGSSQSQNTDIEAPLIHQGDNIGYGSVNDSSHHSTLGREVSETAALVDFVETQSNTVPPGKGNNVHALLHRPLLLVYLNYIFLTFCDMSNSVLMPLFFSTPIEYGGLGLSPFQIGTTLGCFGFLNSIIQAKVLGRLMRYFGTTRLYQLGYASLVGPFVMYPIMKFFVQRSGRVDAFVVGSIAIHLSFLSFIYGAYASIQVLVVQTLPDGGPLGTANGIAQMLSSGMRTVAPTLASSLFAISIQRNLVGGNLVFYILLGITLVGIHFSLLLAEPSNAKGRKRSQTTSTGSTASSRTTS